MQRVSVVVVVLGLLGCGRTGFGEFDTIEDQGGADTSADTSAADLAGQSCESLGYDSGELDCDPVLCVYDASACMIDMGPGGTTG